MKAGRHGVHRSAEAMTFGRASRSPAPCRSPIMSAFRCIVRLLKHYTPIADGFAITGRRLEIAICEYSRRPEAVLNGPDMENYDIKE